MTLYKHLCITKSIKNIDLNIYAICLVGILGIFIYLPHRIVVFYIHIGFNTFPVFYNKIKVIKRTSWNHIIHSNNTTKHYALITQPSFSFILYCKLCNPIDNTELWYQFDRVLGRVYALLYVVCIVQVPGDLVCLCYL